MHTPDQEPLREQYGVGILEADRAPIRFFEGIRFLLRDKGPGAGDSTVFSRLQEVQSDLGSPNGGFFDSQSIALAKILAAEVLPVPFGPAKR